MDFFEFNLLYIECLKEEEREMNFERSKWGEKPIHNFTEKPKREIGDGNGLIAFLGGGV